MWKRSDVIDGLLYRVGLKAGEDGSRQFHLLNAEAPINDYDFVTPVIDDHDLLRWRRYEEIVSRFGIEGGSEIVVDPHGLWLTAHEVDQLETDSAEIEWHRGFAPALAPR